MYDTILNPDHVYGYSPDHFLLYCWLQKDPWLEYTPTVTWYGPNDDVISTATKNTETRFNVTVEMLNMTRPGPDDSGQYECAFEFTEGPGVRGVFPSVQFNEIEYVSFFFFKFPLQSYINIFV